MKLTSSLTTQSRRDEMKRQMIEGGYPRAFVEQTIDLAFQAVDRSVAVVSEVTALAEQPIVMIQAQTMACQLLAIEFEKLAEIHVGAMTELAQAHGDVPVCLMSSDPAAGASK